MGWVVFIVSFGCGFGDSAPPYPCDGGVEDSSIDSTFEWPETDEPPTSTAHYPDPTPPAAEGGQFHQ